MSTSSDSSVAQPEFAAAGGGAVPPFWLIFWKQPVPQGGSPQAAR
jgi:hypothetical protein